MRRFALLLLFPLIAGVQAEIDARLGAHRATEEALYVWSGTALRRMAPGLENLMADLYWLRTVQYFGGQRAFDREKKFDLLAPLVEITTTLDPRFELAYRYGAIFLAEPWPNGAGRAREAVEILEKGTRAMPGSWRLRWDLGYFRHLFLDDAKGGAEVLLEASKLEGAPFWLKSLAATMLSKQGSDRSFGRQLWTQIREDAPAEQIQANAQLHLDYLDSLDALDRVRGEVQRFRTAKGRWPRALSEIVVRPASALIQDSRGVAFDYDAATGETRLSRRSPLWRLDRWEVK